MQDQAQDKQSTQEENKYQTLNDEHVISNFEKIFSTTSTMNIILESISPKDRFNLRRACTYLNNKVLLFSNPIATLITSKKQLEHLKQEIISKANAIDIEKYLNPGFNINQLKKYLTKRQSEDESCVNFTMKGLIVCILLGIILYQLFKLPIFATPFDCENEYPDYLNYYKQNPQLSHLQLSKDSWCNLNMTMDSMARSVPAFILQVGIFLYLPCFSIGKYWESDGKKLGKLCDEYIELADKVTKIKNELFKTETSIEEKSNTGCLVS